VQHRCIDLRLLRPHLHDNSAEQCREADHVKEHQYLVRDLHGPTLMAVSIVLFSRGLQGAGVVVTLRETTEVDR
ncbi:MAG: hypothetical protein K0R13_3538, partial [Propionibacteriaceae bacterium]|nr:hypothetical protein [Propionibacteriaceae bacterium]